MTIFDSTFFSSLAMILLQKKGVNISVIMPYIDNLNKLSFGKQTVMGRELEKNGYNPC